MIVQWLARMASPTLRVAGKMAGYLLVFGACAGTASARPVPEIDPGSASSALGLLVGGALLLKDRLWRTK